MNGERPFPLEWLSWIQNLAGMGQYHCIYSWSGWMIAESLKHQVGRVNLGQEPAMFGQSTMSKSSHGDVGKTRR